MKSVDNPPFSLIAIVFLHKIVNSGPNTFLLAVRQSDDVVCSTFGCVHLFLQLTLLAFESMCMGHHVIAMM